MPTLPVESPALSVWLKRLEALHASEIELGLERVAEVARSMGLQAYFHHRSPVVVTVAGTNGKGSCVATLEAMGAANGLSVGAYSSPHLIYYNERIRVNGRPVNDEQIINAFERIEAARKTISLTYFEFGTLAALEVFRQAQVDVVLLEVGLGGRLDAVNIIDADIAVVTSIDIDHIDWLGPDRESIGREKAGVFRPMRVAICADPSPPESIAQTAASIGADYLPCGGRWDWTQQGNSWSWTGVDTNREEIQLIDLPVPSLPLPSVAAALQVAACLGWQLESEALTELLPALQLAGRFEVCQVGNIPVVLDVAHNPASAELLAKGLENRGVAGRNVLVTAMMADKDIAGILKPLLSAVDRVCVCDLPHNPRAASAQSLAETATVLGAEVQAYHSVGAALKDLIAELSPADRIIVCGSFFTVAAATLWINQFPASDEAQYSG